MKDAFIMQYADYYQMYLDSWEDCVQETFEACNWVNEWAAKCIYWRRISADSATA